MGCAKCLGILIAVVAILAGGVYYTCPNMCSDAKPPVFTDKWYGGKLAKDQKFPQDNPAIKKFVINVKDSDLSELQRRLNTTRLNSPLEDVEFQYGFNTKYLQEVIKHWSIKYIPEWKSNHEVYLNSIDQYTTQIEGLNIHFLHAKPKTDKKLIVVPILITHGWPGSIVEFYKLIPHLITPRKDQNFVFEVICPSIPGYGYSDAPKVSGFGIGDAARVFSKLMDRLGHKTYYVQGGDWGSPISTLMAMAYPERIEGVHVNMAMMKWSPFAAAKAAIGRFLPSLVGFSEHDVQKLPTFERIKFFLEETGYFHIQTTKPDTVGVGLSDSPAGLAAYILEKFSTWTDPKNKEDPKGALTKKYTLDELLNNVMVYWTTNSITSSMRFYKDSINSVHFWKSLHIVPVKVPSAVAAFPHEIVTFPRSILETQWKDLVQYTDMSAGGHFGAMEEPKLLADDLWSFVHIVRTRPVKADKKEL